jgi:1-deoxy-D-xylulose-5-phosphate synthase
MSEKDILPNISEPEDLKELDETEIKRLCEEIRQRIIKTTSENGGHVGPNLGVVELSVALHLAFDTPRDSLVWDVSHQGYVHKLLTGRNDERFDKIRLSEGLSGFLSRGESPHDAFGAGHAGTALSAALGMCLARDIKGEDDHVVAIAGDAAFTCGITLEALNNIACSTKKFILILNDNEWSIAKNVGAFSKYFNELITNPVYSRIHKDAGNLLSKIPGGTAFIKFISKAKRDTKELLAPSSIFEKLGIRYLGPIDGHDVKGMVSFLEFAKTSDEPIVLHLLTKKGKGFPVALEEPEKWHGSGPFDSKTGVSRPSKPGAPPKYQDVFGECLAKMAKENQKIVGITAAMPGGTGLDFLQKEIPDRFFDVGIAEEHAILMAAGMATRNMLPVCAIYSTFLQRAFDQIIHDVCLQNLPVTFCLDRAGLSPNDGPTHHGLFDLSYLRCIPNAIVMQPKDEDELQDMMATGIDSGQPSFVRYPRGEGRGVERKETPSPLPIGKAEVLREGTDCAIWALGDFVRIAEEIAEKLSSKHGLSCSVTNARFVKPLDKDLLLSHAQSHGSMITMEDNVLAGGFGSAVLEYLEDEGIGLPVRRFGWPDQFIEHGNSVSSLREAHELGDEQIFARIEKFLKLESDVEASLIA